MTGNLMTGNLMTGNLMTGNLMTGNLMTGNLMVSVALEKCAGANEGTGMSSRYRQPFELFEGHGKMNSAGIDSGLNTIRI